MKPLSVAELNSYCEFLNEQFAGALLQKVDSEAELLYFEFYRRGILNLVVTLKQLEPHLFFADGKDLKRRRVKKVTPVQVFCQANLRGLKFVSFHVDLNAGRVVVLTLTDGHSTAEVKVTLIPRSVNLQVSAQGKKISWNKPRDLPQSQHGDLDSKTEFDWSLWNQKAIDNFIQGGISKISSGPNFEKQILKKSKALESLEQDLAANQNEKVRHEELAMKLKLQPGILPEELLKDHKEMTYGEALNYTFEKIKKITVKIETQIQRIEMLKAEIDQLKIQQLAPQDDKVPKPQNSELNKIKESLLVRAEAQGRQKLIQDRYTVVMGKSARDNLNLLRKASAWDLWIHLKDQPSAFAILSRNRSENISDEVIREACIWFIEEIHKKKSKELESSKYEFLVGECRNVSPIKGDKLGRVTHRSMRTFSVRVSSKK